MATAPSLEEELDALQSVSHAAVLSIGGVSIQRVLQFLLNLVLTTSLSVGLYGVYAFGKQLTQILIQFGSLGSHAAMLRYIPAYRDDPARQNRILGIAYLTSFVASLLLAAAVAWNAETINALTINHPTFPLVLRLFAVVLPLDIFIRVLIYVFRSLELIEYQLFIAQVARPALRLAAIGGALALGFGILGVMGALILASLLVVVLGFWLTLRRTELRPAVTTSRTEAFEFYNHAAPNSLMVVGRLFQSKVDVLLVGFLLTAQAAGIYNVALFLTSIIAIPLVAFNQLLPPVAARLYSNGRIETLNAVYGTVTRLVFTTTLVLAVTAFVYRAELLGLFGAEYATGSLVLATFLVGRVVNNGVGATGWLLLMTDHQYLRLANNWVLGIMNLGVSYYFILEFGLVGAALGTAGSMVLINAIRLVELWYLEGLQPFDRSFLKPTAAGLTMAVTMVLLAQVLSGATLLIIGGLAGATVFVITLVGLGIEPQDRHLVGMLREQYRSQGGISTPASPDSRRD